MAKESLFVRAMIVKEKQGKDGLAFSEVSASEEVRNVMNISNRLNPGSSLVVSGMLILVAVGVALLLVSTGIVFLGYVLSSVTAALFQPTMMEFFQYVLVVLAISCTAGLGIPILLLARNIQRSTDSFSLLQFDDELEDDEEYGVEDGDTLDDGEELNEFLKKLHKTRNIGPFIPSPKTMDDLCPCGSGLKYKDCCGKFWV